MFHDNVELQNIYTAFHPKILRYLTRLVGEEEAEDLTQEVFIKAGQALAGFRGESSLSSWLYRIATNTAYDKLRSPAFQRTAPKRQSGDPIQDDLAEIPECDPFSGEKIPLFEQQFVKKEMGECIWSYLEKLPESYRTVLVLSDMEGLSDKDISDILRVTLGTVKIRLHRARACLRDLFMNNCEYYWISELSWRVY
jgi:RNA polymerase sigma-70 factor (ECF subfamily)